ncbi:VanZ family protein [Butyrivibrio sp. JL13D10]|uniref:VanZ family protein n=1 Tax=Butyrivibrio sp. JL13D10 TaxID=3236815 RepID=UPI0038B48E89
MKIMDYKTYLFLFLFKREFDGLTLTGQLALLAIEALIVFVPGIILYKKNKITIGKLIQIFALVVYAGLLFSFTVLRRRIGSRAGIVLLHINLGFNLHGIYSYWAFFYGLFNVMLFVPWGIIIGSFLKKRGFLARTLFTTLIGFFTSLAIESVQYVTGTGMLEVTDLLTNTTGAFIGGIIVSIVVFLSRKIYR